MADHPHAHLHLKDFSLVDAARHVLEADGEQWTELRAATFKVLADLAQPASAYDVAERLGTEMGRRIVPNSVYRILDLFVSHNLALRVESRNAFLVNDHPGCVHDCIFLICEACGITRHVDDDKAARAVRKAAAHDGFVVTRPVLEVRGKCADCVAA